MLVSQDEFNRWAEDHNIDPVVVTSITFLRQDLGRGHGPYYVAKIESVATRGGRGKTHVEFYLDGDIPINTTYHFVEYFPGRERYEQPEGQWLRDMGMIGCTRMDKARIAGIDGRTGWFMTIDGQFDLTDDEKTICADLFNEDFTQATTSSATFLTQAEIDRIRAEFDKFDRDIGRKGA